MIPNSDPGLGLIAYISMCADNSVE